jgi:hypothetical protein
MWRLIQSQTWQLANSWTSLIGGTAWCCPGSSWDRTHSWEFRIKDVEKIWGGFYGLPHKMSVPIFIKLQSPCLSSCANTQLDFSLSDIKMNSQFTTHFLSMTSLRFCFWFSSLSGRKGFLALKVGIPDTAFLYSQCLFIFEGKINLEKN